MDGETLGKETLEDASSPSAHLPIAMFPSAISGSGQRTLEFFSRFLPNWETGFEDVERLEKDEGPNVFKVIEKRKVVQQWSERKASA